MLVYYAAIAFTAFAAGVLLGINIVPFMERRIIEYNQMRLRLPFAIAIAVSGFHWIRCAIVFKRMDFLRFARNRIFNAIGHLVRGYRLRELNTFANYR